MDRLSEAVIYLQTCCILFAVLLAVYLLFCIIIRLVNKTFRTKLSHVLQPTKFESGQNVHCWLENFELYLEEDNIVEDVQRCAALLSRLDGVTRNLVSNYSDNTKSDYNKLRNAMIKLFGGRKKTQAQYNIEFATRKQEPTENIHQYYASLKHLGSKAYSTLSKKAQQEFVANQFIAGMTNDSVRQQIMVKLEGNFSKVLEIAEDLDKIYGSTPIKVNLLQEKPNYCPHIKNMAHLGKGVKMCGECFDKVHAINSSSVNYRSEKRPCHICGLRGHYAKDCWLTKEAGGNRVRIAKINRVSELVGICQIDNCKSKFLADTGSSRTIVHESLIPEDERHLIRPTNFRVCTANGEQAQIAGSKKCNIKLGSFSVEYRIIIKMNSVKQRYYK